MVLRHVWTLPFPLFSGVCSLFSEVRTKINNNELILENILSFSDHIWRWRNCVNITSLTVGSARWNTKRTYMSVLTTSLCCICRRRKRKSHPKQENCSASVWGIARWNVWGSWFQEMMKYWVFFFFKLCHNMFQSFKVVRSVHLLDQCIYFFISPTKCTMLIIYKYWRCISNMFRYKCAIFMENKNWMPMIICYLKGSSVCSSCAFDIINKATTDWKHLKINSLSLAIGCELWCS